MVTKHFFFQKSHELFNVKFLNFQVDIVKNPAAYFAQRLYESMKGIGTKDKLLIKLMVLRSEIDMMDIKNEFQLKYKKTLESFIKSDCSGDYKRALLCLAGDPKWR